MLETLYKTKTPEEAPVDKAEYYELILDQEQGPIRIAFEPHLAGLCFKCSSCAVVKSLPG